MSYSLHLCFIDTFSSPTQSCLGYVLFNIFGSLCSRWNHLLSLSYFIHYYLYLLAQICSYCIIWIWININWYLLIKRQNKLPFYLSKISNHTRLYWISHLLLFKFYWNYFWEVNRVFSLYLKKFILAVSC